MMTRTTTLLLQAQFKFFDLGALSYPDFRNFIEIPTGF